MGNSAQSATQRDAVINKLRHIYTNHKHKQINVSVIGNKCNLRVMKAKRHLYIVDFETKYDLVAFVNSINRPYIMRDKRDRIIIYFIQKPIARDAYQTYCDAFSKEWFQLISDDRIFYCHYFYNYISRNEFLTWDTIQHNPDKPWDYVQCSSNPNITWNIVQSNPDKPWDYSRLSANPNITWTIVQSNPDKPWNYNYLSANPNITWNIIKNNPDKPWNYSRLTEHPNITWNIIKNNPDKPWDYGSLSKSPKITWDIVQVNLNKKWDYKLLSSNPNITWAIVQDNLNKPWDYGELSKNPNITWDIVQANPNKHWNYGKLSENPNITWDIIQNNPNRPWKRYIKINNPAISTDIAKYIIKNNADWMTMCIMNFVDQRIYEAIVVEENKHDNSLYHQWLRDKSTCRDRYILSKMQDRFRTSALKEELMQNVFHPKNLHKFADWGFGLDDD